MVTVIILLDNIKVETDVSKQPVRRQLSAILRHFLSSRYQQLLIPLTVYSGVEQAFLAGDFTRVRIFVLFYFMKHAALLEASALQTIHVF